jgi:hypothetical protein
MISRYQIYGGILEKRSWYEQERYSKEDVTEELL